MGQCNYDNEVLIMSRPSNNCSTLCEQSIRLHHAHHKTALMAVDLPERRRHFGGPADSEATNSRGACRRSIFCFRDYQCHHCLVWRASIWLAMWPLSAFARPQMKNILNGPRHELKHSVGNVNGHTRDPTPSKAAVCKGMCSPVRMGK